MSPTKIIAKESQETTQYQITRQQNSEKELRERIKAQMEKPAPKPTAQPEKAVSKDTDKKEKNK
jgi:hypothetical protein